MSGEHLIYIIRSKTKIKENNAYYVFQFHNV